jgi:hypothetical protein
MQHIARSLIHPLAISLCVLCAFAVRLRLQGSNQHRTKRGFLAKPPSSQRPSSQWIGTNKLPGNTLAGVAQVRSFGR